MTDLDYKIEEAEQIIAEAKARRDLKEARKDLVMPQTTGMLSGADQEFLSYVRKGIQPSERKALVEDTAGHYLVSPAVEAEIERALADLVVVRQLASKRAIDKDSLKVRSLGEAEVSWGKLETGTAISETEDLTPAESTKYVEDLYGLVKIGEDELEDSDYNLVAYLGDTFARAIAKKENLGFLKGTGHAAQQPDGICVDATLLTNAKKTAAAGAVTIEDFMQCIYEVPAEYRKGSAWVVNSTVELELRKLRWQTGVETYQGNFLWQPSLIEGRPNQFLGYPIYNDDNMDDLTDTAGVIAIFGNFKYGYRILDRKGMTIQRLSELYAEAGLVGFRVHARVGGYLIRPSNKALVLLQEASS